MTQEVFIRPITAADEAEFLELARASERFHYPWLLLPITPEHFAAYLARFDGRTAVGFVVCRRDTGAMVGMANINQIVRFPVQRALLGYGVFVGHTRRGHMARALAEVVRHGFERLRLHRLEAQIQPDNAASIALVESLGFKRGDVRERIRIEGVWRDHYRWALTAPDRPWSAKPDTSR